MKELSARVSHPVWVTGGGGQILVVLAWILLLAGWGSAETLNWTLGTLPEILLIAGSAAALHLLPGLALIQLLWRDAPLPWTERLPLAWGAGVALPPLLLEIAHLVRLPWQGWTTIAYVVLAVAILLGLQIGRRSNAYAQSRGSLSWHDILLPGMVGLALLVRLYMVRDLPVGMWGDSYHHTMIAQLLVDNRGLFSSWEPYAPLVTFTYHYGFHANVAFFHWLTGLPVTKSVIYVGQILNVATIALAYLLAVRLTRSRAAGLWAALLTGFANTQPVYYANWGRYTQLAGQVILPVVLLCWMETLEQKRLSWRSITLAAVVTACLVLTHYLVTIFAALFLLAYLLAMVVREPTWPNVKRLCIGAVAIGALSVVLAAPWILNILGGYLGRNVSSFVNGSVSDNSVASYSSLPQVAPFYLKGSILALAVVGLLVGLARRHWRVALLAVWSQLLVIAVVPQALGLPGAGIIDYLTAYIALYLPAIPLAAYALGAAQEKLAKPRPQLAGVLAGGAFLVVSSWGARWQQRLIDPQYQICTPADAGAMEWIRTHTPTEARFLVNSFPAYGGTLVAGTDGGWWIPLLARRQTNLPPQPYGSERGAEEDYAQRVNELVAVLRERSLQDAAPVQVNLTTPTAREALRSAGIDYVYSGANAAPGPESADRIDTAVLRADPAFRLVHEEGGVEIFEVIDGD